MTIRCANVMHALVLHEKTELKSFDTDFCRKIQTQIPQCRDLTIRNMYFEGVIIKFYFNNNIAVPEEEELIDLEYPIIFFLRFQCSRTGKMFVNNLRGSPFNS